MLVLSTESATVVARCAIDAAILSTRKASGTGVGLFVVTTTVDNHRGTIEVGESPLGGAAFRISLPRAGAG